MEKLKNVLIIILIIIFTISLVPKTFQNDTFWTIVLGQNILEHGVQNEEELVWHEGLNFINPRWLFDVTIASIYNTFDLIGVYVFVIVMACIQALLYNYILNKITSRKYLAFIFTLITIYYASDVFTARGQTISFLLYILEFYALEQLVKNNKKWFSLLLIVIPILLANVHASVYAIYFIFYLPYIAEYIWSKINLKNENDTKITIANNIKISQILILMVIGGLAGFCTIPGLIPHTYMFKTMGQPVDSFIDEMKPVSFFSSIWFSTLIIITIAIIGFTRTKVRLSDCLFILGFALMAHSTNRAIYFFYFISSICVFRMINDFLTEYDITFKLENSNMVFKIFEIAFVITIILTSVKGVIRQASHKYADSAMAPAEIADYIINRLDVDNIRLYNSFNVGGYLEYRGIKTFIDSRAELFTPAFNEDCQILNDFLNMVSGSESYKKIFEKYGITHAILEKDEIANQYIVYDPEWKQIYDYGNFLLYEKVNN